MQINSYLFFNGQCAEAFKFYEQVLRGKIAVMMTHSEMPASAQMPPGSQDLILHARLEVGSAVLMGSDSMPRQHDQPRGFCVSIQINEPAEAERIFHALEENGRVQMPIEQTFWAERFGMLVDRFGTPWMINCEKSGS